MTQFTYGGMPVDRYDGCTVEVGPAVSFDLRQRLSSDADCKLEWLSCGRNSYAVLGPYVECEGAFDIINRCHPYRMVRSLVNGAHESIECRSGTNPWTPVDRP